MAKIKEFKAIVQKGDEVIFSGLLKDKTTSKTKKNEDYLMLTFEDNTGEIRVKKWNKTQEDDYLFQIGNVYTLPIIIDNYGGSITGVVKDASKVMLETVYTPADYHLTVIPPQKDIVKKLNKYINLIQDDEMKNIVLNVLQTENGKKFLSHPAAEKNHHADFGGLLWHTTRMMELASVICPIVNANLDIVLTGIFFHDFGKLWELESTPTGAGKYTKEQLLGHIYMGAQLINEYHESGMIDYEKTLMIQHVILSHHGKLEWGSPVVPKTLEALIVHQIDMLDAKTNSFENAYIKMNSGELSDEKYYNLGNSQVYKF